MALPCFSYPIQPPFTLHQETLAARAALVSAPFEAFLKRLEILLLPTRRLRPQREFAPDSTPRNLPRDRPSWPWSGCRTLAHRER
ncbi:hypothetical protein RHECNPAF_1700069 [Rhizobium etli CNPAF512]|nr:hypothetical protein RHECNPAF_1700069 [Rhizobium etli CNPAF512]